MVLKMENTCWSEKMSELLMDLELTPRKARTLENHPVLRVLEELKLDIDTFCSSKCALYYNRSDWKECKRCVLGKLYLQLQSWIWGVK